MLRFMGNLDHALSIVSAKSQKNNAITQVATPPAETGAKYANSQVIFTQPQFYSPLHTPQNWQIPSKRREIMQWLTLDPSFLMMDDFTCKPIGKFNFTCDEAIEDSVTGGVMFELAESEKIITSSGVARTPSRMSVRECIEKEAVEIKATGYWRSLHVTKDHIHMYLDGTSLRKVKKLEANKNYRRKIGMPPGILRKKTEKTRSITKFIKKDLAGNMGLDDYLLFPCPPVGQKAMTADMAWSIGLCIADGHIYAYDKSNSYKVAVTGNCHEIVLDKLEEIWTKNFNSTVSSNLHGDGDGWRVTLTTKHAYDTYRKFIVNKETSKKFAQSIFDYDKETRLNVLGGYFDGDGCFTGKHLIATSYSIDLADQVYAILLSVGINCSLGKAVVPDNCYETDSEFRYEIRIPNSELPKIAPYMKSKKIPSDFIAIKQRSLRFFYEEDGITYLAQPVEYIKKYKYTGKGYDLEIKPEHAFIANGYVTSNCRYFVENEPKVAAAIDFYSAFPMNGFKLECEHSSIKSHFDHFVKVMDIHGWAKKISREYYMIGDVFPFAEIACDLCGGTGVTKRGKTCRHEGGSFSRIVILNPDWIDVQTNVLAKDPVVTLLPDDELKRIIWSKNPKPIYDKIPDNIKKLISAGRPIPLSNDSVSHLAFNPYPYGVYGTSLIRRLFKMLSYKDKLMTAQWIIAERLILPIRVVKVGDAERPAGPSDIADVQQQLAQVSNDPNLTLVTHHAFAYDWIGTNGRVLQLSNEFDLINKEILQGLMLNEALLSGEMGGYQSAAIGAEALIARMESWRIDLATWIEERIFKPIAQMKGFLDESKSKELGYPVWIYPKIKWNDLNLRDDTQQKQIWMQLFDKQVISTMTLCEKMGVNYDQEVERLRFEAAAMTFGQGGMGGMGGAGAGGDMGSMDMGGAAGGMDMGMGDPSAAAGGMPPPAGGEMDMGAAAPPAGAPPGTGAAAASDMGGSQGKVLRKGRKGPDQKQEVPEEGAVQPNIKLTSLEQSLRKMLIEMRLPFPIGIQYPLGPYKADFAVPPIRLAIEADGAYWHNSQESQVKDAKRDATLQSYGWTVLRFSESELKEKQPEVRKAILMQVRKCWERALAEQKRQQQNSVKAATSSGQIEKFGGKNVVEVITEKNREANRRAVRIEADLKFIEAEYGMNENHADLPGFVFFVNPNTGEVWADGNTDQGQRN